MGPKVLFERETEDKSHLSSGSTVHNSSKTKRVPFCFDLMQLTNANLLERT